MTLARVSRKRNKSVPCDPRSIERSVRQLLADKVSGNIERLDRQIFENIGKSGGRDFNTTDILSVGLGKNGMKTLFLLQPILF